MFSLSGKGLEFVPVCFDISVFQILSGVDPKLLFEL